MTKDEPRTSSYDATVPTACGICQGEGRSATGVTCVGCSGTGARQPCPYCGTNLLAVWAKNHRCFRMVAQERKEPQATFRELCQLHDAAYEFSNHTNAWQCGQEQRAVIIAYAQTYLPYEAASTIFAELCCTRGAAPIPIYEDNDV